MSDNRKSADKWFAIGMDEFNFASDSLEDFNAYYSQICFEFQQAAEKYLKGYLISQGKTFPKIHDLTQLLKMCAKIDKKFMNFTDDTIFLSQFYLISRYPITEYPKAGKREAERAKKAAKNIIDFIDSI